MDDLVPSIAARLSGISGVAAVALGGSYARGAQRPGSDIDLGLYYREDAPFAIDDVKRLAAEINDAPSPVVTSFGGWGRWVNGGAWLTVGGQRVDFVYRSIDAIERVLADCRRGGFESDFYQQPPYGFHSYIYLGELSICRPLHDRQGILAGLKEGLVPYPQPLKREAVNRFLWSAEFTLEQGRGYAGRGDVYNATGCFARCASMLVQVAYALNERYFVADKGALEEIDAMPLAPAGFAFTLTAVLARPGGTREELSASASRLAALLQETVRLCGDLYMRPDFRA